MKNSSRNVKSRKKHKRSCFSLLTHRFLLSTHFLLIATAYLRPFHTSLLSNFVLQRELLSITFGSVLSFCYYLLSLLKTHTQSDISAVHTPKLQSSTLAYLAASTSINSQKKIQVTAHKSCKYMVLLGMYVKAVYPQTSKFNRALRYLSMH